MTISPITPPFLAFTTQSGASLEAGFIYIGEPGYEARSQPKASFWDADGLIPTGTAAGNPIRTTGGHPVYAGSPARIHVSGDYSITVLNSAKSLVYSALSSENSALGNPYWFATELEFLENTTLSLTAGTGRVVVAAGQVIYAGHCRYLVAASIATDNDDATDGGLKFYVLRGEDGYSAAALGGGTGSATRDTKAVKLVFAKGGGVIPAGEYTVNETVTYGSYVSVKGIGRAKITSAVIGAPLFKPTGNPAFVYIGGLELQGNNLTGAAGNGHAISMIDAASDGTFSPQMAIVDRCIIKGFRGQDLRETSSATKISAAGVAMYNAIQCTVKDSYIEDCGHTVYANKTQNCRILNSVLIQADKFCLFALNNENLITDTCDILNGGDGTEDPGYPAGAVAHGSGVILDHNNQNFVLRNSKIKNNNAGTSLIRALYSDGSVYDSNWIRPDAITDAPHKAFYVERACGIRITNNTFHPSNSGIARDYEMIEFYTTSNEITSFTIDGNTFGDVSGQNIAYNIKLGGNSSARAYQGSIQNNQFGFRLQRSSATTIDADIILSNCSLTDSVIANNNFFAPTLVTRTVGILAASLTNQRNTIGPNKFTAFGGTITAEMSGIRGDRFDAAVIYNPPGLTDGSRDTTTITVTGAEMSDLVDVSISTTTSGVNVFGYVSASNTVTVVFQNNTGGTVDIGSVGVYVTCWRYKGPPV